MNCQQIQILLHAHHDGELDAANTLQIDEHLADCPRCFATWRQLSVLHGAFQNEALRFSAPAGLRQSVRAALTQAGAAERPILVARPWFRQWAGIAAGLAVLGALVFFTRWPGRDEGDRLLAELTASHVRSLMVNHLTDVASTDQHTVKPWFDGKLDFAPPVRDLRESGFPLIGGRLDFIDGRPVAALVFGRQKHLLNLFVWPEGSTNPQPLRTSQRNGYNLAQWSDGKMNFAAVSDLNETELRVFVGDWGGH